MAEEKKTATKKSAPKKAAAEKPVVEEKVAEAPATEETPKKAKRAAKKVEEPKKEAPKKEMPTEARATASNVRVTPRKARLVIDQVRGKDVSVALGLLRNINKAASEPVSKLIRSAAANAVNNFGMDQEKLYVAQIYANDGMKMRRYLPRAKGSASGLVKRSCHITVVVKMR
jgi:large subunit ribosomal protein L22